MLWHLVDPICIRLQLLVFELGKHGYAELAEFLGVEQPATPYPKSNASAEFKKIIFGMQCVAIMVYLLPCMALALVLWASLRQRATERRLEEQLKRD